jgi:hypothetical protein
LIASSHPIKEKVTSGNDYKKKKKKKKRRKGGRQWMLVTSLETLTDMTDD